jgi:hypothetical protein
MLRRDPGCGLPREAIQWVNHRRPVADDAGYCAGRTVTGAGDPRVS